MAHALASALAEDPETVVISVDVANAFNSIHRAAMLAAVQQSAPALLPMVQWAYGDETPLHIVGAPEGTPPVMSQGGVRQGDPLGPLLFALTLPPVLERVDATCEEAPLMSYLDEMSIVGKLTPAAGAFRRLCVDDDGVRSTGLDPRLPKCGIYGGDKEQVAAEAAKLRIAYQLDGFTAVGSPLGSAEYVSNALGRGAAAVETLVDTLVQLPLSVQSQFLLLRASLQARMVHLMRTVPREALATHMRRTDAAVWRAAAAVLDLPPRRGEYGADMEGPDKACSALGRQMMLPAASLGARVAHAVKRSLGRSVRGWRWPSRAQPEGAPSCALPSARGWWRLRAGEVAQPSRTVRGAVQMGRSSEGPADGVPGQKERAAWGTAPREEEGGLRMPC